MTNEKKEELEATATENIQNEVPSKKAKGLRDFCVSLITNKAGYTTMIVLFLHSGNLSAAIFLLILSLLSYYWELQDQA